VLFRSDVVPANFRPLSARERFKPYFAFLYILRNAKAVHLPFTGGPLGRTRWWRLEPWLLRRAGIRMILLPYGGDSYLYSRLADPMLRHALLLSYPAAARRETALAERVQFWIERADAVINAYMLDAFGRWDVLVPSPFCIDVRQWKPKTKYSTADGRNGAVRVLHTPNHRGFKGTEFLVAAVETLRAEGLDVDLVLLERVPNERVREVMQSVDILAEQFIATAYALSGIEGLASGLPVMANLDSEYYTRIFRRYSFLDECPIVSTTPETLVANLRALVTHPDLRRELGVAGQIGRAHV
jgi:hypothetical protein